MKSRKLIEYEAWMEDWFRKHPLPPMSKKARRRIAKMLRQSLKSLPADPVRLAAAAQIDPTRRAETIPISGFVAMARELANIRGEKQNTS